MVRNAIPAFKRLPPEFGGELVVLETVRFVSGYALYDTTEGTGLFVERTPRQVEEATKLGRWLREAEEERLRAYNRLFLDIYRQSPYRPGGPKPHPHHHSNFVLNKLRVAFRRGREMES